MQISTLYIYIYIYTRIIYVSIVYICVYLYTNVYVYIMVIAYKILFIVGGILAECLDIKPHQSSRFAQLLHYSFHTHTHTHAHSITLTLTHSSTHAHTYTSLYFRLYTTNYSSLNMLNNECKLETCHFNIIIF